MEAGVHRPGRGPGFFTTVYLARGQNFYVLATLVNKGVPDFHCGGCATVENRGSSREKRAARLIRVTAPSLRVILLSPAVARLLMFGSGGSASAYVYTTGVKCSPPPGHPNGPAVSIAQSVWGNVVPSDQVPHVRVFSLAARPFTAKNGLQIAVVVAVGGAYDQPDDSSRNAAVSSDGVELI